MQSGQWGDTGITAQKTQQIHNAGKSTVLGAIRMASARTGVDFAYLLDKAKQESGLNPSAKASTSSASGLFQFIGQTWLKMVKEHGEDYGLGKEAEAISTKNGHMEVTDPELRKKILNLRHDPVLSAAMAAEYTRENKDYLDSKVGGTIGSTELYLAHFLGANGAGKFLKAMRATPNADADSVMPEAADANPSVFYDKDGNAKSLSEIYANFAAKFKNKPTGLEMDVADASVTPSILQGSAPAPANDDTALKRDIAELSPSLYQEPDAPTSTSSSGIPLLNEWRRGGTSDTLFNAMILAQTHMNDALGATHAASRKTI